MTILWGLKIVSPCLVTFAELLRISRIQWHSSREQLVLRNSLLQGTGSRNSGQGSACPDLGRDVDLAGESDFFKYPEQTPPKDPIAPVLHTPHTSCCLQLSFNLGFITEQNFPFKYFLGLWSCLREPCVQSRCQKNQLCRYGSVWMCRKWYENMFMCMCLPSIPITHDPSAFSTDDSISHVWSTPFP